MARNSEEYGRQILSYWTAERMQSAQPEPDPEFSEVDMMIADQPTGAHAILSYWSPERLASAQPEPLAYGEHIETEEETIRGDSSESRLSAATQAAGSLKIVPDNTVKTFPYQSVGKLFYTKVSPSGSRDSYASAWVANVSSQLHVVVTAAHCLERGNETATNILFIPGFIPPSSRLFGSYPQIPGGKGVAWSVDPNWNPNSMQAKYDQGMIKLDKDPNTGKYVDEVVIPIQILSNQNYTPTSEWNTIGFPVPSSGNPDGKMAERSGTYFKMSSDGGSVYKYGTLPKATSGGPWILAGSHDSSNGIQAGNVSEYQCAQSPYFKSTAEELVKLFFRD